MVNSKNPSQIYSERGILLIPRQEAKDLINQQILKSKDIKSNSDRKIWLTFTRELLRRIINTDEFIDEFNSSFYVAEGFYELQESIVEAVSILNAICGKVDLYPSQQEGKSSIMQSTINSKSVFLVHGHEVALLNEIARFLEKLELDPIILFEQPNIGSTIIEKLENNSDTNFAIVLLTPDDLGKQASSESDYHFRARQNVVFELGFFIGKLGRSRVVPLFDETVELPSDYRGIGYIKIDTTGAWKISLARELKAAGFEIDMNKVL